MKYRVLLCAAALFLLPMLAYAVSANLTVTVVPAGSTTTPPAQAAAAGFTTLAANYDFSQPLYAVQSNWLDCSGTNASLPWHIGVPGWLNTTPCNINQRADPSHPSTTVMDIQYLGSYSSLGLTGNANSVSMQTVTKGGTGQGGTATFSFPNAYVEAVYRTDPNYTTVNNRSQNAIWTWLATPLPAGFSAYEFDIGELYGVPGADAAASPGIPLWATWDFGCTYNPGCTSRLPSGYDTRAYHKYGAMWTSNGTNSTYLCAFVDDRFQACNPQAGAFSARNILIAWSAAPDTNEITSDLYIQYIRVWSCASWATGQCYGSTLFGNGGNNLSYWH